MRLAAGVDMGGTKILACVATEDGKVLAAAKRKTRPERGSREVLDRLARTLGEALAAARVPIRRLAGVGVAVPGAVESATGMVRIAPNLGWKDMPVRRLLERKLGRSVVLANDANAGLYGEAAFGAAAKCRGGLLAGVFVGTGVGGALMAGGRLIEGAAGYAGEIGHVTVAPDGPRCGCGNRGCLETLASRSAVVRRISKRIARGRPSMLAGEDIEEVGSRDLARAWRRGDRTTVKEVREAGRWLGIGVAGLVNLLNPDAVVLGGGFLEALGRPVHRIIVEEARRRALAAPFRGASLLLSRLGDHAAPLGAAALALAPVRASRR